MQHPPFFGICKVTNNLINVVEMKFKLEENGNTQEKNLKLLLATCATNSAAALQ